MKRLLLFETNSPLTLRVFHGTKTIHAEAIRRNGLVSRTGYGDAGWYMVASDMESALFHGYAEPEEDTVSVFEFEVPAPVNDFWEGYPYLWAGYQFDAYSTWYALYQPLPVELLVKEHLIPRAEWAERKRLGFHR